MSTKVKFQKITSIFFRIAILLSMVHTPTVIAQGVNGLKRQLNSETGNVSLIGPETRRVLPQKP